MKKRLLAFVIVAAAVVAAAATHPGTGPADTAAPTAGSQGYRVYIDAATNAIVSEPNGTSPVVLDPEVQNALSTSGEGLHEVESPVGGGEMIDLQGRFQNTMMATIDADGRLVTSCVSGIPGTDTGTDTGAATKEAK